jgi:uncharacterized protein
MHRAFVLFVVLAVVFSWVPAELAFRLAEPGALATTLIAVGFMWGPALAAVVVTRGVLRQPLRSLGPVFRYSPWLFIAWLAPLGFAVAHLLLSLLAPGVSLSLDAAGLADSILAVVPPEQQAQARGQIAALGDWLGLVLVAQLVFGGLLAGATLNALVAFGEELGWRGLAQRWWQETGVGFWRGNLVVGVVWGLWHAPLILRGHNYPEHPQWGVAMMVLFCVAMSPLYAHVRERAGSLLAPSVLHGTLNATGGTLLLLSGASDLWRGPAGGADILVLLLLNLWLWRVRRRAGTA